ncbi:MAG TPA: LamG-like jellyroll fold domain-containing protein [Prolixibacteraceae bacterium]|nr:LamG-like jellyroll fold domain-containing protein [Prolixibacteraceae bacterium]
MHRITTILLAVLVTTGLCARTNRSTINNLLVDRIMHTKGLTALWLFDEKEGTKRKAFGKDPYPLTEMNGTIPRISEGPLSGYSAEFRTKAYLMLPNSKTGKLNIYGTKAEVTVVAWIKWSGEQTGFVGGMWNEYQDGGKRQYGLFISLPYYNGRDQVCGHISRTGKPTPPFPFSIDYSASKQRVPANEWCCAAFSYDGTYIKSYLNGKFEPRGPEPIDHTKGFEGYPEGLIGSKNPWYFPDGMGDNGSDFTVGAVLLKSGMGNYFRGQIGGLAVFNRALTEDELSGFYP